MEPMKTFTVGADTWEIVDGAAREELADARTGADGTEYESTGAAIRGAVNGINDDLEANYALQDGYYEMLTAGSADNLTGRGDGVGAEFIYRPTHGNGDITDGVATIESVKGNTLVFNQLVAANTAITQNSTVNLPVGTKIISGNKYLLKANFQFSEVGTEYPDYAIYTRKNGVNTRLFRLDASENGVVAAIATATESGVSDGTSASHDGAIWLYFPLYGSTGAITDYQLFDLTRMFGAGNEPATVEEFEALYPASYYAYDAGSLLNVNMQGVRTVGFNQFDGELEVGYIDVITGANAADNNRYRSKNFIPVFANTDYFIKNDSHAISASVPFGAYYYDENKNFISTTSFYGTRIITTPSNCRYMRFFVNEALANSADDICVNLSWSGYRNGEYEPYWTQTREIDTAAYFPDGMKSAGSVYDEMTATKAVKRVGVVDLGTLDWAVGGTQGGTNRFYLVDVSGIKAPADNSTNANLTCTRYKTVSNANINYNIEGIAVSSGGTLFVYDKNYESDTTAATFKAAMSGVMLNYELAEPVETEITPELNLTYKVSDFGTEEIIVADNEQTAPVPMQIVYGLNAVDTIRRLPVEYISHKSFMQFISAIESHFNVTITETYDSDNERYNYSIATNESGE
jgi:hypothetical protein